MTAIIGLLLFVLVYLPLGRLGQRIASPIRIVDRFESFQEGDVIWYSPLPEAQSGDFVVYRMPDQSFNQGNTVYRLGGDSIGRVLATEGQTVSADGANVAVDNHPLDWTTAHMVTRLKGAPIKVPQGRIFVYADVATFGRMTRQQFLQISIVSPSSIRGSVLFRSFPIGRISRMNPRAI